MSERPVATPLRRTALGHRGGLVANGGEVRLSEIPLLGKVILRADRHAAAEPLREALGFGLPFDPLTSSSSGDTACLWIGPDEWMLVISSEAADALARAAAAALAGLHHQLTDVTDYYTTIEVAGLRARELLMKLTTLDLHPRAFRLGMTTGSLFGRIQATIWRTGDDAEEQGPVFRLFVRWSMADYLWCLLADAGREWNFPEQVPVTGERLTLG